ncbi:hypothetical protein WUBG_04025 [Wuchereria bancrofti]|uniref:G-protein coupled receptors family 1 profile domain-containing protein n=2 Tax=Wuchereria bancrofti TaxID=6293 RepID=J9BD39_WUCBA|nr:hypothetical protein WUBG_04025 [Wuchereria bancrofti]
MTFCRPIQKPQAVKIIGLNFALATAISLPIPCSSSKDLSNTRISVANFAPKIGTLITWVAVLMTTLFKKQTFYRQQVLKRRLRTNRMLIAMVGVFVCCWMPAVVFNFLRDYHWLPNFVIIPDRAKKTLVPDMGAGCMRLVSIALVDDAQEMANSE